MASEKSADVKRGLSELGSIYTTAFDSSIRIVMREMIRMDADEHPRMKALARFLSADDATEARQRLIRYALQTFGFELLKRIAEREDMDITFDDEHQACKLLSGDEFDIQMVNDWCRELSAFGDAYGDVDELSLKIERGEQ